MLTGCLDNPLGDGGLRAEIPTHSADSLVSSVEIQGFETRTLAR